MYFQAENDVLKGGKPLYTIDRTIKEMDNKIFGDESHIIYVNGECKDNTELGRLMQDFFCKEAEKMNYKLLADKVSYFKKDEGGISGMCQILEEVKQESKQERNIEIALNMISEGDTLEKIARVTGLSVEEVKKLAEMKPV